MKIGNLSIQKIGVIFTLLLLSGCAPALTSTPIAVEPDATSTSLPVVPTEASASVYQPVSAEVCQMLKEDAEQSLGLTFTMEVGTPFTGANGETGLGCSLTAITTGAYISDPYDALTKLVNGFVGWTEQLAYQAGGPTGAATGLTRDSGLMLISVSWQPSAEVTCPADQPIGGCALTPEQRIYTVKIQAAQK